MDRSCRGQQRVTKTNSRSSVLNIATHKKNRKEKGEKIRRTRRAKKIPYAAVGSGHHRPSRPAPALSPGRERERERGEAAGRVRGRRGSKRERRLR
jgi:hypothetical protein